MKKSLVVTLGGVILAIVLAFLVFYGLKAFGIYKGDLPFWTSTEKQEVEKFDKTLAIDEINKLSESYEVGAKEIFLVGKNGHEKIDIAEVLLTKQITTSENTIYYMRELGESAYSEVSGVVIEYNEYISIINTIIEDTQHICIVIRKDIAVKKFGFENISKTTLTYSPMEFISYQIEDYILWNCRKLHFQSISYLVFYEI